MKTWEMIKELSENPKKKFVSDKGTDYEMVAQIKNGCLYIEDTLRGLTSISMGRVWEEVKEPVDFMTAIESGKHVGVEYPGVKYKEMSLPNLLYELQQDYSHRGIQQIILNGKWYIED